MIGEIFKIVNMSCEIFKNSNYVNCEIVKVVIMIVVFFEIIFMIWAIFKMVIM